MFKKPFKVSNSHSLSNKDKKKLREKLVQKQKYSAQLVDHILSDANYDSDDEFKVCKIAGSKCAYYQRGANPLLFCADGDKLTSHVPIEPSLYLVFQQMLLAEQNLIESAAAAYDTTGAVRVYLKQGVEKFLFRGAPLMWPGIFHISTEEFRQNDVVVILARNTLISDYISTLGDYDDNDENEADGDDGAGNPDAEALNEEETKDDQNADVEETKQAQPSKQTVARLLSEFIPVGCGRMLMGSIPASGKGRAVELHHYLFDKLWKIGNQ